MDVSGYVRIRGLPSLCSARLCGRMGARTVDQKPTHLEALIRHHKQLEVWAAHNPTTFENRAAIVGAEIARIEGRPLEAQELYEKAFRSAHANRFVHNEALVTSWPVAFTLREDSTR